MATRAITKTMDFRQAFLDLNSHFALNEVTRAVEINGKPFDRFEESRFLCLLRAKGARNEAISIREIEFAAYENKYHPIKQYLNSLSFDGHDYVGDLCSYFKADKFFEIWLRRWLIMAIARVVSGAQCPVLVLDGPQNKGKSKFVAWLCSSPKVKGFFTEGQINPGAKDARIRATQKWIWEVPEFGATARKADQEELKGFITLGEVTERTPYARSDEKRPMLACFVGTINNGGAGFLSDPSGSRRFLIAHIDDIDWKGYTANLTPDQIWGQAYAEFLTGEPFELTPVELDLLEKNNQTYEVASPLQSAFESLFEIQKTPANFMPTIEIIQALQDVGYKAGNTNTLSKELAQLLMKFGLQKTRQRQQGSTNSNPVMGYLGVRRII